MLLNENYKGIGDILANSWSLVLFAKHILVLAMVGLGIYQGSRVIPNLAAASKKSATQELDKPETIAIISRLEKTRKTVTQALCGLAVLVLLLTAIGEVL